MLGRYSDRDDTFTATSLLEAACTMERDIGIFSRKTKMILNAQINSLIRAYSIKSIEDLSSGNFLDYSEQNVKIIMQTINTQAVKALNLDTEEAKTVVAMQKWSGEVDLLKSVYVSFYNYLFRIIKANQNAHPFVEGSYPIVFYAGSLGNSVSFAIDDQLKPIWHFLSMCISPQEKEYQRSELIKTYGFPTELFWKPYIED
jgi:hypothetical protein